jgi:peptidylglycine monooxygenase
VYLLATNGRIPPNSIEHMETSCPLYETGKVIHPFAYRVHTHELGMCYTSTISVRYTFCFYVKISTYITIIKFLFWIGKVVAGYRVKNSNGVQTWDLLGKRDPMTPQMFYPIEKNITVKFGDILVSIFFYCRLSTCTYITM